jgi:hypothetical protein
MTQWDNSVRRRSKAPSDDGFDLDDLLHPAQAFAHPSDVVSDPDLTLNEKRAILASWASDACAVEAVPPLRRAPGSNKLVTFDEIIDALRTLDKQANEQHRPPPRYRRVLETRVPGIFGGKAHGTRDDDQGPSLN